MTTVRIVVRGTVGLLATALLVLVGVRSAHAQNSDDRTRRGSLIVTDPGGQPIPFTTVILNNGGARVTNARGFVDLGNSVKDSIRVFIRRIGYQPFDGKLGADADGAYAVSLTATRQLLSEIRVNGERAKSPLERTGFYERMLESQRGAYNGEFYTPEALDARPAMKVSQLLANSRLARVEYNAGLPVIRGRGGCVMAIIVDGQRINGVFRGSSGAIVLRNINALTIDDLLSTSDLAAVEIYPHVGNAPSALQPLTGNGSCGLIAFWTGGR